MKVILIILFFLLPAAFVFSQSTVNYTFTSSTTASMTDMSSGTTTVLIPSTYNGDFIGSSSIGFDFWLMGIRYDYFSVNSNGLMRLGKVKASKTGSNSMNSGSNLPFLTAFWDDLNSYTISANSRSKVICKVTGAAPTRVLTVEWKNFIIRKNSNNGVQLSSWQVRLYETSGIFEFVYGRMQIASSSSTVNASIGMSSGSTTNKMIYLTNITSPAITRTAGAGNNLVASGTVGNIVALNSAANGSRKQYRFTSWLPTGNPTGLNFTSVTAGGMTLNWTDNATNEFGYVIYRSDDGGLTYRFSSQVAAGVTSSVQGALAPGTLYYWKVYAVTEGALSASLNGNQATIACIGLPATNTMALTGSSGTAVNWSSAAAWSLGHAPTACENAVITYTRNGGGIRSVNMDVSATVNNLTINGIFSSSGNKFLTIKTNGNSLNVLGDLNMTASGGTGTTDSVCLFANNGSTVTIRGNTTIGVPLENHRCIFGAFYGEDPDIYFKGNVTFNNYGKCSSPGSYNEIMGSYFFEGGASQTLTNNSNSSGNTFNILFGNVEIGATTPSSLTIGGSNSDDVYTNYGNLVVNNNSSLILPYDATFNQNTAGYGDFILKPNAVLKLADDFGGQSGSNFPADYDNIALDVTSTVEYNGIDDQIIYDYPVYGNLILTNNSVKYIISYIEIGGNLLINPAATLGCDYSIYMYGPSVINNGVIEGGFPTSEFSFYGDAEQNYSGSGIWKGTSMGDPFEGLGINLSNPANVNLSGPISAESFYLFNGSFINSNNITIGSSTWSFVQRGGDSTLNAGSFDSYPVINSPANYTLYYYDALSNIATGPEIPADSSTYKVYSNNNNGVTLTSNLIASSDLQLLEDTLDLGINTLTIGNTITKTTGIMNGANGTLAMNGTSPQTLPANVFQTNKLKNLIINNSHINGVTLGGTLDVYRSVTFGPAGLKLATAGFLTFKSTATETAWLGNMTGKIITGNATVERYIPLHSKAWQFLSVPTSGQTIKQSWQEGATTPNENPVPGYGTQLTGAVANATTQPTPGFDVYTPLGASIKIYNSGTPGYGGVTSTANPIANPKGYMLFVRGDRSATSLASPVTATVLRSKGTLYTPANPPSKISLTNVGFESVGNPYASAIDFRSVTLTGGVQPDFFYLWDPKLTTTPNSNYGLGGFQSFSWNGAAFDVTPGGGSYAGTNRYIESGQAFFVHANFLTGSDSVKFSESCKVSGSNIVNRVMMPTGTRKQLRTNFYVITGENKVLLDGNMIQYNRSYVNSVDINDGRKLGNTGENLGLLRDGKILSVERRSLIQKTDTVFYKLGQLKIRQYQLEFIPNELEQPKLAAFLEDNYLHTSTEISLHDTSRVIFNVINVPGSYAPDRFRLVFRQLTHSQSTPVTSVDARANSNDLVDNKNPGQQHTLVKSPALNSFPGITAYPNPVMDKNIQLHFCNQPAGSYNIQLINKAGQVVYKSNIVLGSSDILKTIPLKETITTGTYQLYIIFEGGNRSSQQIIIQ